MVMYDCVMLYNKRSIHLNIYCHKFWIINYCVKILITYIVLFDHYYNLT